MMVGHGRDTPLLGTAGIVGDWPRKSASTRARTTFTLKSNFPTARVGKQDKPDKHFFPRSCFPWSPEAATD